jgi:hypothetical protein
MARASEKEEVKEAKATEAGEKKEKRQKDAIKEGWGTPVDFTHYLAEHRGLKDAAGKSTTRPQVIFGYTKNNKAFQEFTKQNTDGRTIINLEAALAWWDDKENRKAAKAAEKTEAPSE